MGQSLRICYKAQKTLIIIHPHSRKPCIAGLAFKQNSKELKHQRRRRLRKRHLKSEFALPQTLSHLFQLVQFVKCWQIFLELNSKTASKFRKRKRKSLSCDHVLDKAWNLALSRCSPAATAKKCTKKRDACAKLLFCQTNPIASLPFSLPSLLKLSKAIYGEASPQGATPYPFIHNFWQKRWPFYINSTQKWLSLNITSWLE